MPFSGTTDSDLIEPLFREVSVHCAPVGRNVAWKPDPSLFSNGLSLSTSSSSTVLEAAEHKAALARPDCPSEPGFNCHAPANSDSYIVLLRSTVHVGIQDRAETTERPLLAPCRGVAAPQRYACTTIDLESPCRHAPPRQLNSPRCTHCALTQPVAPPYTAQLMIPSWPVPFAPPVPLCAIFHRCCYTSPRLRLGF